MNKTLLTSLALLSFFVASPVLAATFSTGQSYTLDKQTTLSDDLYAAAGSPIISGTILGDAMLAGGTVTFDGSAKNLMAAGGTITMLGNVSGSIRALGGTITLSGPVGTDFVAAGGTVSVVDTSTIGRDAAIAGGNVQLDGTVGRNATIRGGTVVIDGTINGNVDVQASQSLTLGAHAVIKGTLTYSAPAQLTETPGSSVVGAITYNAATQNAAKDYSPAGFFAAFIGLLFFVRILAVGTAIIVATTIFNRFTHMAALSTIDSFWKHLCIGFVVLIIVPIVCIALFVSVFGLIFGALGMLVYGTLIIASKVLAPIVAGAFLSKWYRKEAVVDWKWALLGLIALDLVALIPILGWVVSAVLFLAALGTLASLAYYAIVDAR